jgi:glyoxylase-like metal-dependent hydrolase (beta-lactamase superfamily II)
MTDLSGPEQFRTEDVIVYKPQDGFFLLETSKGYPCSVYVIVGSTSALVIDAGYVVSDLTSAIKRITDKPYELALTHGHSDHIGALSEFDHVYVHSGDRSMLSSYTGRIIEIRPGHKFDLGERVVETIDLMGHTPGSIGFLDVTKKLLITGDAIGSGQAWMSRARSLLKHCWECLGTSNQSRTNSIKSGPGIILTEKCSALNMWSN